MPTAPRTVTGNVATLTGEARAGIKVTFTRTGAGDVFGQYGDVVVNEPITVTSGEDGALSVVLYPGAGNIVAAGSNGPKRTPYALTEDGSTDLADLIGQASAPITSTEVAQAQAARDAAEAAQAAAETAEANAEAAEDAAEAAQAAAESARDTSTGAATTATTQAGIATSAAGTATTQAGIATTQAGLASAARTGAETAETNAETAQAAAEAARDLADADRIAAQAAQAAAEAAQAQAEAARANLAPIDALHPAAFPLPVGWWDTRDRLLSGASERAIISNWQPDMEAAGRDLWWWSALEASARGDISQDTAATTAANDPAEPIGRIDDEITGLSMTQATANLRFLYGRQPVTGVRNLLTNSDLAGAVAGTPGTPPTGWTNGQTTGQISAVAADGLLGGNSVRVVVAASRRSFQQTINVAANTVYRHTMLVDVVAGTRIDNVIRFGSSPAGTTEAWEIDGVAAVSNDQVPTGLHTVACVITVGATPGTSVARWGTGITLDATADIRFWAPQVTTAADADLPYQRTGPQGSLDVTEEGVPTIPIMRADLNDDRMGVVFPGSGNVTGTAIVAGRAGTWVETVTNARGVTREIQTALTTGLLLPGSPVLGLPAIVHGPSTDPNRGLVDALFYDRELSEDEIARVMRRLKAAGAKGRWTLGAEINTDVEANDWANWSAGTGWSDGTGKLVKTVGAGGSAQSVRRTAEIIPGSFYLFDYDVVDFVAQNAFPILHGATALDGPASSSANGRYLAVVGPATADHVAFGFRPLSSATGLAITRASVRPLIQE